MTKKITKEVQDVEDNIFEKKIYVEIGPNLRTVLKAMVDKVYTCNSDSTYYKMAFEPIYHIIQRMVDQKEGEH